jgi:hypothetical protein
MAHPLRRFAAIFDLHWGYENVGGHKKSFHDPRAWETTLKFLSDFKPQDIILGGDILDCGAISHHNQGKPRKTEGFRLLRDAEECHANVIKPLESILPKDGRKEYIVGNHEDWIEQLLDEDPALEGLIDIRQLLKLGKWNVTKQGGGVQYGKLYFVHGDTVTGGEHVAKAGVVNYERNLRFGHHHTYQTYTKTSPIDTLLPHTGIAVPCLCSKDVGYMRRRPNRWVQGFEYGYMSTKGPFSDNIAVIINGQLVMNGKTYTS